jgi:hypothetical protein
MKKILTLLFAVATVAAFAAPTLQKAQKLQPQKSDAKVEMKAQKGDIYTGKAGMTKDYTSGVDTMYLAPKGTFYSAYFHYGSGTQESFYYSYNMALLPTNVETTWTNISTGIASENYDWVLYNPAMDEENLAIVEGQKDLATTFPNYPGWWISPRLMPNGYNDADYEAGNYYAFGGAVQFGGKFEDDVLGDGTTMTGMYQFSPRADYLRLMSTQFSAGYGEDANVFFTDLPSGYKPEGAADGKIVNFIQYFNYPGHPYTFSRIQLIALCSASAGQTLTAKVCKVENNVIDTENPIAVSTYEFAEDVQDDSEMAIDFYFEKEDPELGLTQEDWIVVDGEIGIVIEGVNEIESITPVLSGLLQAADDAHSDNSLYYNLCNGYSMWNFYDEAGEVVDASIIPCHLGYYWGSSNTALPVDILLSINAQMAYIETKADNATEYTIPAEGGEFTLELKASEPYDAWAVEDIPEWINIEATDQMDTDEETGTESYSGYTTLTITVEPGNNGTVVYTLPGTEFKIIVGEGSSPAVPGDVDGDGSLTAGDVTALYNWFLNGDDSALVNPDQDGDGAVTSGDVTYVYNLMLNGK